MERLLQGFFYKGFKSGMRFITRPTKVMTKGQKTRYVRLLLLSPSGRKMEKCLRASTKLPDGSGLPDLKKPTISRAFGELYRVAASHVDECAALDPKDFFGHITDMFPWAITIPAETLWAFTYRCFHARDLFKEITPGWRTSPGQPLVEGLDKFRRSFTERYAIQYGDEYLSLPADQRDQEQLDHIMGIRAGHLRLRSMYFPQQLTCAEYDGDGTDRQIRDNQPGFLTLCAGCTEFLDEDKAEDPPGTGFQRAVAQGIMNADGDVNPDWEGEQLQDEEEEAYVDEDADVEMEDAGDDEGGEEVQ